MVATSEKATKQKSRKNWGLNIISKVVRNLVQSLFLFPLLRVSYRIKIIGRQNLDSVNGPSLLIGNHVLHLDHVIYIRALPSDIRQNLAVAAGEADIAVANTYYYALMLSGKKGAEQQEAAKKVRTFFPNQQDRGTHMNISGAGMLKYAPNKDNAVKLVEFLLTKEAQEHIVNNTFEYPMIAGIKPNELVPGRDMNFKQDLKTSVKTYGDKQADALEVMLTAGWK